MVQILERLSTPSDAIDEVVNTSYPCQFCNKPLLRTEKLLEVQVNLMLPTDVKASRFIHVDCLITAAHKVSEQQFDKTPGQHLAELEHLDLDSA